MSKRKASDFEAGVQPKSKKRKFESFEHKLSRADRAIFDQLKTINRGHKLWTYFSSPQQGALEGLAVSANRNTFRELKGVYIAAKADREESDRIEKANDEQIKAALKNTYEPAPSTDKSFAIMFMNIGSGDCIFLKTPDGKTIVVDCGQRSTPNYADYQTNIKNTLKSPIFLGGEGKPLYALILTHPDQDHYNELVDIVKPCVSQINHVFFTLNKGDYGEKYTHRYLKQAKVYSRVTINKKIVDLTSNIGDKWKELYKASGKKVTIVEEKDCKISLLAAEVPNSKTETKENAASIVTLIEVYKRKILLCGDATYSTETFLIDTHKTLISDVDLMQLEHHGSGTEHAAKNFIRQVNPRLAVASSGPHKGDMNPRWRTIEKYVNPSKSKIDPGQHRICKNMDEHRIKYAEDDKWQAMDSNKWFKSYLKYGLYTTESNQHLYFLIDKNGNLIREFTRDKRQYRYKISADGTVTDT